MSSTKTYTAGDIQRYHNGGMTPAEMHSLEKAAMEDPMLADALDGYMNTTTPSADLQTLQSRLQQRIENDKKSRVVFVNRQWLKIAALFMLIAGGGWLVLQTFSSKEESIATLSRERTAESTIASSDSVSLVAQDSAPTRNETVTAATSAQPAPPAASVNDVASNEATRRQASKVNTEVTETKANDAVIAPAAAGIAAVRDNTTIQGNITANDTSNGADAALQKEAVPATDVSANRSKVQARASMQSAGLPQPNGGWSSFEKYITANKKPQEPAIAKPSIKGVVSLSFDLDKNGRPVNIVITKSLCESCDAEAARLLREGPSWKGSGTKGNVSINF